jgi:cell wall-associated NlpC family hydrolase
VENKENPSSMTTLRMSSLPRSFRPGRRTAVALLVGAGVALSPLPAQAAPVSTQTVAAPAAVVAPNPTAQVAVDTALAQLGKGYAWAGTGPNVYDCSGLTQFAYRAAGVALPHSSGMQSTMGVPVSRADLQPGDLVFFYSPVGHVGMYIGNGLMVHAPSAGDVVKITSVDAMWGYNTARRLT